MKEEIRYLQNQEIDKSKWDKCIKESPNGLIYAASIYLDHMCETWDAIVINDYEAVMPIPLKKKYGVRYVYQPPFVQQLGLVYRDEIFNNFLHPVLQKLSKKIKFGDYSLNFFNKQASLSIKNNFVLFLNNNYENIYFHYKDVLKRNLKNANKKQFIVASSSQVSDSIDVNIHLYSSKIPQLFASDFDKLKLLCNKLLSQEKIIIREAKDEKGNLLASNLCLKDSKRIYLLLSSTTPEGRKKEANHFLLDHIIKEFAGQELIFDFEGSDIPGIAYFYQGFGATNQPYYFYHWNHLSLPVKMMKKIIDKISR
jgi:hypothetical protein